MIYGEYPPFEQIIAELDALLNEINALSEFLD